VEITKQNVPTLPLVMVGFVNSVANPPQLSSQDEIDMTDAFVVEFWLEPAKYKKSNGGETPFWSYYDYETVRDTLLSKMNRFIMPGPGGEQRTPHISYRGLNIEAQEFAVTLTFAFIARFNWCTPNTDFGDKMPAIGIRLCAAESCVPDACYPEDPCK
jgi:hypothetical protein